MGADLYIESIKDESGYFRDCYNSSGLAVNLGFSWWKDVVPMLHNGYMSLPNVKRFLNMVENSPVKIATESTLRANHCTIDNGKNSVREWNRSYLERKQELIRFLRLCIKLKEEPLMSL